MPHRHISHRQRRNPAICIAAAVFAALFPHSTILALDWSRTEIEQRAEPGEKLAPYVFTFTNSGASDVKITNTRLSCSCLLAEFDDETIKPGATGKLTVHFDRAGLVGEVVRTLSITTDEPGRDAPYELAVRADLPEPLTPVITVNFPRGISTSTPLRLCSLAPLISILEFI